MRIIFQDQAEYYYVCEDCYYAYADMQWAGSTRGLPGWRQTAQDGLAEHEKAGKPCEFCGPNGNGGWAINGKFYAAEKRDARKKAQS